MKLTLNSLLGLILTLCLFSCSEDEITNNNPIEPPISGGVISPPTDVQQIENEAIANVVASSTINASVLISVNDADGTAVNGATVTIANQTSTTTNGVVVFNDIPLNTDFVGIKITHPNYITAVKNFTPTETTVYNLEFTLFEGQHENIIAAEGAELSFDSGVALDFKPNSFVNAEGIAYEGEVTVNSYYHTETDSNYLAAQPGALVGLDGEELTALATEGMLTVDLTDAEGNEVFIAEGQTVQVTMPAAPDAPATIDLWHLNESYGIWVKTGTATKVGEVYEFSVTHFSTYNLDVKIDAIDSIDFIVKSSASDVLAEKEFEVYVDGVAVKTVTTDANGQFSLLRAPMGVYTLKPLFCAFSQEVVSQAMTIESEGQYDVIISELNDFAQQNTLHLSGELFNCEEFFEFDRAVLLQTPTFSTLGILNNEGVFHGEVTLCDAIQEEELLVTLTYAGDTISEEVRFVRQQNATNEYVLENTLLCEGVPEDLFVTIEDEALLALIKEELGLDENQGITRSQAAEVQRLGSLRNNRGFNLPTLDVASIVDNFPNLSSLTLECDSYTNFDRIGELIELTRLTCENVADISALSNLTNLVSLYLLNSNLNDISALSDLVNLNTLYLYNNNIQDISALSNLTNLVNLDLANNNLGDISALSDLVNLNTLYLDRNNIQDISALSNCPQLEFLDLNFNHISNISPLSALYSLIDLHLEGNAIDDIYPLLSLYNLNVLNLRNIGVSDISALSNLMTLNYLDLTSNTINDISPLSNLTALGQLYLGTNDIIDITALSNLDNLQYLELSQNDISDLSPLYDLNGLNTLFLVGNPRLTETQVNQLREILLGTYIEF